LEIRMQPSLPFPQLMINPKEATSFDMSVVMPQSIHTYNQSAAAIDRAVVPLPRTIRSQNRLDTTKLDTKTPQSTGLKARLRQSNIDVKSLKIAIENYPGYPFLKQNDLVRILQETAPSQLDRKELTRLAQDIFGVALRRGFISVRKSSHIKIG